jgi:hypothetical protein
MDCKDVPEGATNEAMNKAIVTYDSLEEMKAEELREWRALPPHERLRAVAEITLAAYRMKEHARCSTNSKNSCPSSTRERLDTWWSADTLSHCTPSPGRRRTSIS